MVRTALSASLAGIGVTVASMNPIDLAHLLIGGGAVLTGLLTSLPKGVDGVRRVGKALAALDEWWLRRRERVMRLKEDRLRLKIMASGLLKEPDPITRKLGEVVDDGPDRYPEERGL